MKNICYNFWLLLYGLLTFVFCRAQSDNFGTRIILSTENITQTKFYVYEPSFKAKAIYKDLVQVKNNYPEELMSSILSANTQEWVNYNNLRGEKEADVKPSSYFEKVKKYDINKTFFELQAKLSFKANGNEMAIIKFYFYQQDKENPVAGALIMQKKEGIWKTTSRPYLTPIAMALMVFKPQVLKRLLSNDPLNSIEERLLRKVYSDGFSFDVLLQQKLSDEEKKYFTNPLNW